MMEQFKRAKKEAPEALLFFRMGDFYEMFFRDAELGGRYLDLTVTSLLVPLVRHRDGRAWHDRLTGTLVARRDAHLQPLLEHADTERARATELLHALDAL